MKTYQSDVRPSDITPREAVDAHRRRVLRGVSALALGSGALWTPGGLQAAPAAPRQKLAGVRSTPFGMGEKITPYEDATHYNNFYEFGTGKDEPAERAHTLRTNPWTVSIEGEVKKPKQIGMEDILKLAPLEERIYRLRCVEGWAMAIPWVGFELAALIRWAEPTSAAKYVEFVSLADPAQMPGVRRAVLDWPYTEGLRMDEAVHPLTLLTVGMYGDALPNQNGAPLRLVVPWKYGFKSAKSIVRVRFLREQPRTSWGRAGPGEYGFYANVNPDVDHPRWSQASERRIGAGFFERRQPTQMFNGYAAQVASLYRGMDLRTNF